MSELRDILQGRHDRLAASMRDAAEFDEPTAIGAVKRRRRTRALTTVASSAAGVAAAAIGVLLLLPGQGDAPVATTSPTPSNTVSSTPSATPSATASSTPSASPSAEPAQTTAPLVTGDDIAILERLENPTTGETWHEPVEIEAPAALADTEGTYLSVGTHGDADIVLWVSDYYLYEHVGYDAALYEVDGSGVRWIRCPSVVPNDECEPSSDYWETDDRTYDIFTNYDSLTLPRTVTPAAGWSIDLSSADRMYLAGNEAAGTTLTQDRADFLGYGERSIVAELGPWTLMQDESDGFVDGLVDVRYRLVSSFGASIELPVDAGSDYAEAIAAFTASASETTQILPASRSCFRPNETIDPGHDPEAWVASGTNDDGQTVYVPVDGGNDVARAVYDALAESSFMVLDTEEGGYLEGAEAYAAFAYASYDEFLAARSVLTWDRGDGVWVVGIDARASQVVYECA
ncbi:hypothetical protein [Demequina sp. NBRC 110054]|uniref:hypothetical protein n=1 Tax=Demequina sp. NBRC 110054 TaxID=1570343 RepID=UPI0009FC5111|nr:hypothetical protein [Demequina sp. NBRC 110054]